MTPTGASANGAGINKTINFQGRLLTNAGAVVPDGSYNLRFKVYQDGDGQSPSDTTGTPGGMLEWTELWQNSVATGTSSGVTVKNGYFSVNLGSYCSFAGGSCQGTTNPGVNFDYDTLWVSMDVGGTAVTNTPAYDGEMLPMKRLSSTVYSLQSANSDALGGLAASQYVQLAQGIQTAALTSHPAIGINATSGTANLITLQSSATDVFDVTSTGNLTFGNNADKTISIGQAASGNNGNNLTIAAGSGNGTSTSGGNLILQGGSPGTGGTGGSVVVKPQVDSTYAFQVLTAGGNPLISVDSSHATVTISGASASASFLHDWTTNGMNQATVAVAPSIVGDLMTLAIGTSATAISVTGVSGGGVSGWHHVVSHLGTGFVDLWEGSVTTTGASTVTITYSATPANNVDLDVEEYSAGVGTNGNWVVTASNTISNSSSTTLTFPSVVATWNNSLYVGYVRTSSLASAGSTSGFSYHITSSTNVVADDPSAMAGLAYAPSATSSGSGTSDGVAMIVLPPTPGDLAVDDALQVAGTASFDSSLSVQATTDSTPTLTIANSDGTTGIQIMSGGSGGNNTFIGLNSGQSNLVNTGAYTGIWNTSLGVNSLQYNSTGTANTALGGDALQNNSTGGNNTAVGIAALASNMNAVDNTALGYEALQFNNSGSTGGSYNTGVGIYALLDNTSGSQNTGFGYGAGANNITGSNNTYLGYNAGNGDSDTFTSLAALQNSTAIGTQAEVQASNSLVLGGAGSNQVNVGIGTTIPVNPLSVSPLDYNAGQASVTSAGTTVTGSGTYWRASMVGEQFLFANGQTGTITAVTSTTSLTLNASQPVTAASNYRIHLIGLQVTSAANVGIGTSNPTAKLQVAANSSDSTLIQVTSSSGGAIAQVGANGDVELGGSHTPGTVGLTSSGSTNASGYNDMISSQKVTTGTTGGTVTSMSTNLIGTTSGSHIQFGIYADSSGYPGALIATSALGTPVVGTNTLPISATLAPSTTYWFTYWTDGANNNNTYNTGSPANSWYFVTPYSWQCASSCTNGMPNTFPSGGSGLADTFNVWATYEPASALRVTGANGSTVLQNSSNSTTAFQVQNASGTAVLSVDTANSRIGVGTNAPTQKLEVANGNAQIDYGSLTLLGITESSTPPTVAVGAAGVLNSTYYYQVTFVTADGGETSPGTQSAAVSPASQKVNLSNLPIGPAGTVARKIYRSKAGAAWPYPGYYLTTISDNSTTTYTDNTPDSGLGGPVSWFNTTSNISNPQGEVEGEAFGQGATVYNGGGAALGYDAFANYESTALGTLAYTGNGNSEAIGYNSATDWESVSIGSGAATWDHSVAIGTNANAGAPTSYSISIGENSYASGQSIALGEGATTTASNQLVIGGSQANGTYIQNAYIGSGVTDASPQNITLHATGGSGTNVGGASLSVAAGIGTGTANGGNINFGIAAPSTTSSATPNTTTTVASLSGVNGAAYFQNTANSTSAFQIQDAAANPILGVDTTNKRLGVNTATPSAALNVVGTTSDPAASSLIVNDSGGNNLVSVRNDGQVVLGKSPGTISTYGHTVIGATPDTGFVGGVMAQPITTGPVAATLNSITVYIAGSDPSPHNKYDLGIYTDAGGTPGTLIAQSAQGTITTGAWNTLAITASLAASTTYWLTFATNATNPSTSFVPYDAGSGNHQVYTTYGSNAGVTMPSTFTTTFSNTALDSIYANVTEAGALASTLTLNPLTGVTVATPTNSTTAFQVQNASSAPLLTADTSNMRLGVNVTYSSMTIPSGLTLGTISGGSLSATTAYYYKVTAIDSAGGETTPTAASCIATTSTNKTITLYWTAVTGASGYRIYRTSSGSSCGADPGGETFLTTVQSSYSSGSPYSDTGSIATSSAFTLPASNTAYVSTNVSNANLTLSVGGNGTPTAQVYVGGTVPTSALSTIQTNGTSEGMFVQGKYAYVVDGSTTSKLQIYDVSNPSEVPNTPTGSLTLSGTAQPWGIEVVGNYAYITDYATDLLQIVDVSNPMTPTSLGTVTTHNGVCVGPRSVYVEGHYAYVVSDGGGVTADSCFQVFDVSNPSGPVQLGPNFTTGISQPKRVYVQGRYAYVANSSSATIETVDILNPASPSETGLSAALTAPHSMTVAGRYSYVADYSANALEIIDETNPASPTLVGSSSTGSSSSPQGVYVQGRYAYVVDGSSNNMKVFDVSNPTAPFLVGTVATATGPVDVQVVGRYAYVLGESSDTVQIFDMGGAYDQQLQAGGTETGTLVVDNNASIQNNLDVRGGLEVASGAQVGGSLNVTGTASVSGTNSTTAFQVQNATNQTVLTVDTQNQQTIAGQNSSSSNAPALSVQQSGSGDATMQLQDASDRFFVGVNSTTSNSFNINSYDAANSSSVLGENYAVDTSNGDDSNTSEVQSTRFVASASGTISSISAAFGFSVSDAYSVAIYQDNGSGCGDTNCPGTLLGKHTGTGTLSTPVGGANNWNTLTLDSPVAITAGTAYWLAVETTSGNDYFNVIVPGYAQSAYRGGVTVGTWANWSSNGTIDDGGGTDVIGIYANITGTSVDNYSSSLFNLSTSGQATFRNLSNSTAAFVIENATSASMLQVDTTDSRVYIGNPTNFSSAVTLVVGTSDRSVDPAGTNGAIYYNGGGIGGPSTEGGSITSAGTFRCYQQGRWQNCLGMRDIAERRWGYAAPAGATTTLTASGLLGALTQNGGASDTGQSEGNYVNYTTGTTSGNAAGVTTAATSTESRWLPKMVARFRTGSVISSSRVWVGMTNSTLTGGDGSGVSFVGLRYSTSAGDTDWQCVSNAGGATPTTADTGVAVNTGHYYDVIVDESVSGEIICSIADDGGAYRTVYDTTVPAAATTLFPELSITTLTTAARSLEAEYLYLEQQ
ncbi:MAG TPA: hypothetical protein VGH44_00845 [Candidatus Saccharimonadia bacterium]|jgi:hypothetical protein